LDRSETLSTVIDIGFETAEITEMSPAMVAFLENVPVHEEQVSTAILASKTIFISEEEEELLSTVVTKISSCKEKKYIFLLEARGGTDKDHITGHRRDSIPIAIAIAGENRYGTAILSFLEEDDEELDINLRNKNKHINAMLRNLILRRACGLIVRNNPGTLSPATQCKLDALLGEFSASNILVMSPPDVQRSLGAKDALHKIKHLKCGLEDTNVYYEPGYFSETFLKNIAFRPRVIKQNRGSQGEGIWICKLKNENYCEKYGDRCIDLDEELVLMEANDNHVEYHTAGEFIEFCIK